MTWSHYLPLDWSSPIINTVTIKASTDQVNTDYRSLIIDLIMSTTHCVQALHIAVSVTEKIMNICEYS